MGDSAPLPPSALRFAPWRSLSGKVLLLTMAFVMLGEVLIFLPSIANFRIQWFKARIAQAEIAALAAEAAPDQILNDELRSEILRGAGVTAVSLKKGDKRQLVLRATDQGMVEDVFDLRSGMYFDTVGQALSALLRSKDRLVSVVDVPPAMSGDMIEIALHEQPLSEALRNYALRILALSVVLSLIVAGLIFAALARVLVRPMQRLSANMMAFAAAPEDASRIIRPSRRRDELGMAEQELQGMQSELHALLQQKSRLAAVGLSVSKVSHDLRNMLASAQLISDRLSQVRDPQVQRFSPKLIASLDRAINFLTQTLKYGQARERPPEPEPVDIRALAEEVLDSFALQVEGRVKLANNVPAKLVAQADREQLSRILTNLVRNAVQALESADTLRAEISVEGRRQGSVTVINVADTGPGIPAAARSKLFSAFQSVARSGGTGLGLAISAELAEGHGGALRLASTGSDGTVFTLELPDPPANLSQHQNRLRSA